MKKIIRKVMADIYFWMEAAANEKRIIRRNEQIRSMAIIGDRTIICRESRLQNIHDSQVDISVGYDCAILGDLVLFPLTGKIQIGNKCFIGPGSRIWSASSVEIGDYVMISHNVGIYDTSGHSMDWQRRRKEMDAFLPDFSEVPQEEDLDAVPIVIENDVWIGANATLLKGVRIGRGSIIGASAVVTKDVEPFSIVAGNPMRVLKNQSIR